MPTFMYRQDYILRLIEQFGRSLTALAGRIAGRQILPGEARAEIATIATRAGLDLGVARTLDPEMLLMWLAPHGQIDPGKFWLLAELLRLEALQHQQDGQPARARFDLQRGRLILERLDASWRPEPDLPSAGERLDEIGRLLEALQPDAGSPLPTEGS